MIVFFLQLLNKALLDPAQSCFINRDMLSRFRGSGGISFYSIVLYMCVCKCIAVIIIMYNVMYMYADTNQPAVINHFQSLWPSTLGRHVGLPYGMFEISVCWDGFPTCG